MPTASFLVVLIGTLLAAAYGLARYMQGVYDGRPARPAAAVLGPVERLTYRLLRIDPSRELRWTEYARGVLLFSAASMLLLYALQRLQGLLLLNPADQSAVRPDLAFTTAVSFVTNTNWQSYTPEQTMSYLTQMVGLAVQNFVSAAVGMAVAVALIRGIARSATGTIGNFWADLVRGTVYVLLPISLVLGGRTGVAGRRADLRRPATRPDRGGRDADHRPSGRPPARSRSSSWAPTAAASTTPTPPTRWRAGRRSRTFSSTGRCC